MSFAKNEVTEFVKCCSALMEENKQYLIDLDSALGDGDLGLTMTAGFAECVRFITESQEQDLGKAVAQMGMAMAKKVPSTMGTLVASGFMGAGKAVKGQTELDDSQVAIFFKGFVDGVMSRGKAQVGDRTIVDSIHPAYVALQKAIDEGKSLKDAIVVAFDAACAGLEATKDMKPKFGRAVYYGDQVLGKVDQGAVVGKLVFEGLKNSFA